MVLIFKENQEIRARKVTFYGLIPENLLLHSHRIITNYKPGLQRKRQASACNLI